MPVAWWRRSSVAADRDRHVPCRACIWLAVGCGAKHMAGPPDREGQQRAADQRLTRQRLTNGPTAPGQPRPVAPPPTATETDCSPARANRPTVQPWPSRTMMSSWLVPVNAAPPPPPSRPRGLTAGIQASRASRPQSSTWTCIPAAGWPSWSRTAVWAGCGTHVRDGSVRSTMQSYYNRDNAWARFLHRSSFGKKIVEGARGAADRATANDAKFDTRECKGGFEKLRPLMPSATPTTATGWPR